MPFPRMMKVRQHFEAPEVEDIPGTVKERIAGAATCPARSPGATRWRSPWAAGGINNIAAITRAAVEALKELGAEPFIVPAMGSHGGGTAEGQREIVESYGVTEEFVGCPIRSTMEVVQVGTVEGEVPVYFDKYASEADHVVVAGRVKPSHRVRGGDRVRPPQDDAHRPGQAPGRRRLPPGDRPVLLRPHRPRRGPRR